MVGHTTHQREWPGILCLSGLDPSGGAGLAADIMTIESLGGHALPIATVLTTQDTANIKRIYPIATSIIQEQIAAIEKDIGFDAVKIGLISEASTIQMIGQFLSKLPTDIPVIVDPIVSAGGGFVILDEALIALYREHIIPHATVITPNLEEARAFAPEAKTLKGFASALLKQGAKAVLITGIVDKKNDTLTNKLYTANAPPLSREWPYLPIQAHGTGCTLASALAAMCVFRDLEEAVQIAQHFAFHSVVYHYAMGKGQVIPNRLFWAEEDDEENTLTAANDEQC